MPFVPLTGRAVAKWQLAEAAASRRNKQVFTESSRHPTYFGLSG
jgi:hypothetical protein